MTTLEQNTTGDIVVQVGKPTTIFGVNVQLSRIKGWPGGVSVRRPSTERINQHGNYSERGWRGVRLVTLEGSWWADSRREAGEAAETLAAVAADGESYRLVVLDEDLGTRWANSYLYGTPDVSWDQETDGTFTIDLECPDPRRYGEPETRATGVLAATGGLTFPLFVAGAGGDGAGILNFGEGGPNGTLQWENVGKAETTPVFRVHGPAVGFTITEIETQRRIAYKGVILGGQYVEVDCSAGTVLLNGETDRSSELTRAQWSEIPAQTSRTYLIESASLSTAARLEMFASPAWW